MSSFRGAGLGDRRSGVVRALYTDRGGNYWQRPEARGRFECMLGTLQNRLPQELRLRGITAMVAANRFLADTFLPAHNQRFAIMVEEPGGAFVPFAGNPEDILCVQEDRAVGKDNPRR